MASVKSKAVIFSALLLSQHVSGFALRAPGAPRAAPRARTTTAMSAASSSRRSFASNAIAGLAGATALTANALTANAAEGTRWAVSSGAAGHGRVVCSARSAGRSGCRSGR